VQHGTKDDAALAIVCERLNHTPETFAWCWASFADEYQQ